MEWERHSVVERLLFVRFSSFDTLLYIERIKGGFFYCLSKKSIAIENVYVSLLYENLPLMQKKCKLRQNRDKEKEICYNYRDAENIIKQKKNCKKEV